MENEYIRIGFIVLLIVVCLIVLRYLFKKFVPLLGSLMYYFLTILSIPFRFLNGVQRFLSKPWRCVYKKHHGSDGFNNFMRIFWNILKIPFYIFLTPLRLINAVSYNIVMHCSFEFFNYLGETIDPESKKEGGGNFILWLLLFPLRIFKYGCHYLFSFIESIVWTVIDTFVPALTLYHGTDQTASEKICQGSGRVGEVDWYCGVWNVGSGNYAGNGIYFAPLRSTAIHYARYNCNRALIICRVSLGKIIDIGMAPKEVYYQCGSPNAFKATEWGLNHGYTTGEWWRGDEKWWEYCMYDWQNRYNSSWRIRPLYVEDLNTKRVYRIHGGMSHWLFRKMVVNDLMKSLHLST